ncbi:MAG: choice-of-anchor Q domain-containing protein [Candidatus Promineifilaceae bacterium]
MSVNTAFAAPDATCDVPTAAHVTLQAAVDDVTCSTINITTNGVLNENITIGRTAIIKGAVDTDNTPLTIIDGQALDSVFTINGFNTVVLRNLVVRNGEATQGGGVHIVDDASVTLDNVVLTGNSAENGGGLYANNGFLNVINSQITHNTATKIGGGILGVNGSVDMRDFGMYSNSAEDGGAIGVANAALILQDGKFTGNNATRDGGALFLTVPNGTSTLTNLHFNNNTADNFGGAIFSRRGLSITGSTVNDNKAANGGGIYIERNNLNLMETHLTWNQATENGGGIYATKTVPGFVVDAKLTVTKSSLTDNMVDGNGGAIFAIGDIDTTLNEVGAYRNSAENGGVIMATGTDAIVKINGSTMQHNVLTTTEPLTFGGAVNVTDGVALTISNSYFSHNNAYIGGALSADKAESVSLFTSAFAHNTAGFGGAVRIDATSMNMDSMYFGHNTATSGEGGAIYTLNTQVVMRNTTVYKNSAPLGGGLAQATGSLDIEAVAFDSNTATAAGGGLAILTEVAGEMRNSSVTNNTAGQGGGLFMLGSYNLRRVLVGYNTATSNGGGLAIQSGNAAQVTLDQASIYRNSAPIGGGINHAGEILNLTNSTVSENSATTAGSAIHGPGPVIAAYSTIAYNTGVGAVHKLAAVTPFIFEFSIIHNPAVDNCTGDINTIQLASTIDSDGTCSTTRTALTGVDPLLAPLTDNGNDLLSHALLAGSPALGGGENCPLFDQHDNGRPTTNCDLGAYQTSLAPTAITLSSQTSQSGTSSIVYTLLLLLSLATISVSAYKKA